MSKIDEVLTTFRQVQMVKFDKGEGVVEEDFTVVKARLRALVDEVIGEKLPDDMYGSWSQRKDGSLIRLSDEVIIRNTMIDQQRQRADELFGKAASEG